MPVSSSPRWATASTRPRKKRLTEIGPDQMAQSSGTVFVLGAGFTKAFYPNAPLMRDNWGVDELIKKFGSIPGLRRILEHEKSFEPPTIDIERLMTRLDEQMPYDLSEIGLSEAIASLLQELKCRLIQRIQQAGGTNATDRPSDLEKIAGCCVKQKINCVTFNYDDFFDRALWKASCATHAGTAWRPDMGYSFFCRPSTSLFDAASVFPQQTKILLLKLHGSVNWFIKFGSQAPYLLDSVVHHADWYPTWKHNAALEKNKILEHLEKLPFIVPPILAKRGALNQPILRKVWEEAYHTLGEAESVVFLGYRLPPTDIAASFLFGEALQNKVENIKVVVKPASGDEETLKKAYRAALPGLTDGQFFFQDARDWLLKNYVDGH